MTIPFLDLKSQYLSIKDEVINAVEHICNDTAFIGGKAVDIFEESFAKYCNASHCIGVGNGTDALWLALKAMNIGPGDEVIVPVNTFIASVEAISAVGAIPVFVDNDVDTYTIDIANIEKCITPKSKAIIAVHLYGQSADMDPILDIAAKHGLKVVEDAAQAHGAEYKGRRVGSIGDVACFSFYPGKNLGAYGDGGAVVTNNREIADIVRLLSQHGSKHKYQHKIAGYNSRLDGIQAAVLNIKMKYIEQWTEARRKNASLYCQLLEGSNIIVPFERKNSRHVYHLFVVRLNNRDEVQKRLLEHGIQTAIHYPIPIHLTEAYVKLGIPKGTYPLSETYADEILSLPMYAELSKKQIHEIVYVLREIVQ
ncbi:DegT/DnrJ/EryC1/StrS family aminotransferase [Fictibacillus enclensis]|uniref:DegT/DnrJ/EryC1/StrS family aminotransferase n=1 Tax=Fictibacillus enclensis TaxID=1017270 RepID=UPI0024C04691|nr:DegT/DnrJ/EryC1/StrS family aminotransferase [Fictibacillus enclensis]WHY71176.1 DegT/DnrJ/EryC1/StrS family aminotransferase [Fictibacillus enclensis]